MSEANYDQYYVIETEGGRRGLVTCLRCGVAVLIGDADIDTVGLHDAFHNRLEVLDDIFKRL